MDKKAAAKTCKCGRPMPFPLWYLSKAKRCAACSARAALEQLKRG